MRKLLLYFIALALCSTGITACGSTDDYIEELFIRTDTIFSNDTIIHTDTTFLNGDTIIHTDTIVKNDTLIHNDTLKRSDITISYYMDQFEGSTSVQGADIYDKYLFQFRHTNSKVFIYDIEKKSQIGVVTLEAISMNHCNTVSFSNIFYNENDSFPLLYVSGSSSGTYNHVQVYRVTTNEDKINLQKIQEITLPECNENNQLYWTGVVMDNTNNYMYIYANHREAHIAKLEIPDIYQPEVILFDKDILEQFSLPSFTHQQGACINDNMLFVMDGVPQWGDTNYLRIIDLKTKKDVKIINITDFGYGSIEFESISRYKDGYILGTFNRGFYSLKLNFSINE